MRSCYCILTAIVAAMPVPSQEFHTTPDKWKEPRPFHRPVPVGYPELPRMNRVIVGHAPLRAEVKGQVFSPNKAYWYLDVQPTCESIGAGRRVARVIDVFTERSNLLRLTLNDSDCRYPGEVSWINEKLLFVRVWWGRVLGSDLILDVESEKLIYHETLHDGVLAFMQWQGQMKTNPEVLRRRK